MRRLLPILPVALVACGTSQPVSLQFEAVVAGEPVTCGGVYRGVGSTGTTLTLQDLRFYVHDVRLVAADGTEHPVRLTAAANQGGGVALLDFEDGGSACEFGDAELHTAIRGEVEADGPFRELRLRLGVPQASNFLDIATARAPLDNDAMYWGWLGGYKYLRFEGRTTGQPEGFFFHLGATDCTGTPFAGSRTCAAPNMAELTVALPEGFSLIRDRFVVDVAEWMRDVDLDRDLGETPGCMASATDPDCETYLRTVGLPVGSTQRLIAPRVQLGR